MRKILKNKKMTKQDKIDYDQAMKEYRTGKMVKLSDW